MIPRMHLSLLDEAAASRRRHHPVVRLLAVIALGIVNLLVCAYMERLFQDDPTERTLLIALTVESGILAAALLSVYRGELRDVVRHTLLLPVRQSGRLLWIVLALLRHPATIVLWCGALFLMAIVNTHSLAAIALSLGCTLLLGIHWTSLVAATVTLAERHRSLLMAVAAAAGMIVLGLALLSPTASSDPLLELVLPVRWTAAGIQAGRQCNAAALVLPILFLAGPPAGIMLWSLRRA